MDAVDWVCETEEVAGMDLFFKEFYAVADIGVEIVFCFYWCNCTDDCAGSAKVDGFVVVHLGSAGDFTA